MSEFLNIFKRFSKSEIAGRERKSPPHDLNAPDPLAARQDFVEWADGFNNAVRDAQKGRFLPSMPQGRRVFFYQDVCPQEGNKASLFTTYDFDLNGRLCTIGVCVNGIHKQNCKEMTDVTDFETILGATAAIYHGKRLAWAVSAESSLNENTQKFSQKKQDTALSDLVPFFQNDFMTMVLKTGDILASVAACGGAAFKPIENICADYFFDEKMRDFVHAERQERELNTSLTPQKINDIKQLLARINHARRDLTGGRLSKTLFDPRICCFSSYPQWEKGETTQSTAFLSTLDVIIPGDVPTVYTIEKKVYGPKWADDPDTKTNFDATFKEILAVGVRIWKNDKPIIDIHAGSPGSRDIVSRMKTGMASDVLAIYLHLMDLPQFQPVKDLYEKLVLSSDSRYRSSSILSEESYMMPALMPVCIKSYHIDRSGIKSPQIENRFNRPKDPVAHWKRTVEQTGLPLERGL